MKRLLFVSVFLLASVSLFAAKPFKVNKGSLGVLKQEAAATWTIDLSEACFVNNGGHVDIWGDGFRPKS